MPVKVGNLRAATALSNSDTPIEVVSEDKELNALLCELEVVEVYPDTTDGAGNWHNTFKVVVRRKSGT